MPSFAVQGLKQYQASAAGIDFQSFGGSAEGRIFDFDLSWPRLNSNSSKNLM